MNKEADRTSLHSPLTLILQTFLICPRVIKIFVTFCSSIPSPSFEGQLCTFAWVLSLLGRYFYNMYRVKMLCFTLMLRTIIYFPVNIILDFPISYRNTSVMCQSDCACLHQTVNMVVFFVKSNQNTYPKGRALMQMYRVASIRKRRNNVPNTLQLIKIVFYCSSN